MTGWTSVLGAVKPSPGHPAGRPRACNHDDYLRRRGYVTYEHSRSQEDGGACRVSRPLVRVPALHRTRGIITSMLRVVTLSTKQQRPGRVPGSRSLLVICK